MKIRVEKSVLADAVSYVARMLPAKSAYPILAGVVLSAESDGGVMSGGSLGMSVFDFRESARTACPADVIEPGKVIIAGKQFAEIVKSLPAKPVDISTDGSRVLVTCGGAKFTLLTMPVGEYPTLPTPPAGSGVIPGDVFSSAVSQVAIAASRDQSLPILTGVRVDVDGATVRMMATDRYRLAVKEIGWRPCGPDVPVGALVNAWTLSEVAKTVAPGTDVTVGFGDLIGFESAGRQSTSLLMDGDYPKVMALFPSSSDGFAVVNRAVLVDAVKRVGLVAERNTAVGLAFSDGWVTLDAGQGEDAQATDVVDASLTGVPVVKRFNQQFLLDGLNAIPHQYVRFSFTGSAKPAVLTGQPDADGDDDRSYRYLIMPVSVGG